MPGLDAVRGRARRSQPPQPKIQHNSANLKRNWRYHVALPAEKVRRSRTVS
jgi:hypothetical protein